MLTVYGMEKHRDAVGARISLYMVWNSSGMLSEPGSHCVWYGIVQECCGSQEWCRDAMGARILLYRVWTGAGTLWKQGPDCMLYGRVQGSDCILYGRVSVTICATGTQ